MKKKMLVGCVAVAVMVNGAMAAVQDGAVAGRKIVESSKDAVIKVKVLVQQKMMMNGNEGNSTEETKEITGTVIEPSGLVVVSLSAADPSKLMETLLKNMGSGKMKMEMDFQIKDVKLILPDGTEIEAGIVLRDKDLDLAFIRPTQKPAKPLAAIDLSKQTQPQILDDVLIVTRLGKIGNHEPAALASKISAIVRKPRLFYVPQLSEGGMEDIGTPVFAMNGKPVGMIVMRMAETHSGGGFGAMLGGAGGMGMTTIVLPAAAILESAKQAVEAKAEKNATDTPAKK